jgi:DegV family protein with EDD domain
MRIGIVTDSTSDLPSNLIEKHSLEVVPAVLVIGEQSFADGEGLSRREFYARLPTMRKPPTTASPSTGSFQVRYEKLLCQGADQILSIHAPMSLSGIYNAARLAAKAFGGRVKVLDSGQISLGLGFQVLAAAEAIGRGALLDEVLSLVGSVRQRIRVVAMLDTLEYVRRSGRVSWARAKLGDILSLKPLVELQHGLVKRIGNTRTRRQGIDRLCELIKELGALERLAILHTNAESAIRQLVECLQPVLSISPLIVNVTTVIGTHIGPNGLGFAAVRAYP